MYPTHTHTHTHSHIITHTYTHTHKKLNLKKRRSINKTTAYKWHVKLPITRLKKWVPRGNP